MPASASGWHRKRATPADVARAKQYASREHRELRAAIKARISRGEHVTCWRCGAQLTLRFHLGHDDNNRQIYRGPECPSCNVKAAARKGAQAVNSLRRRPRPVRRRNLLTTGGVGSTRNTVRHDPRP